MLGNPDWMHRHAALFAISCIGEGAYAQLKDMLEDVVTNILPLMKDPHPRVRFACCNALGQMAADFAPQHADHKETEMCFQSLFHATVIPAFLELMADGNHPRVQAHSAAALVNFCEHSGKHILEGHLDSILSSLAALLGSP